VRLLHRDRERTAALAEGDCYDHSYGEGVLGNVELVAHPVEPEPPADPEHHVTTERLKRQFEERLAARSHRRR
jgi:hypothetical protein